MANEKIASAAEADDLEWQMAFDEHLKKFLEKECKGKNYHCLAAVEISKGKAFTTSVSTLSQDSSFASWRLMVGTILAQVEALARNFDLRINIQGHPIQSKKEG